ncbi:MAG: LysM peptidoglycan-binding domain-containing protein [Sphingomonas sp.]|uniref:phage tail tip lysozyme n=1 Tax=Sphingomonas sp. TaxID=28214 RepID=UPI001B077567|nr:phage tail tip lysozyme [Sphingomonas sp.]MBO9623381.1 LysM peptidoglycan-binding domain-containing protein [Sphingomonas sp.]
MVESITAARAQPIGGSTGQGSHVVKRGDTLSQIAAQNGVSLSALLVANPQITHPNLIFPGQEVRIPTGGNGAARGSYTVKPGDTLSGIAARYGLDWHDLALDNGLANPNLIFAGQTIRLSGPSTRGSNGTGGVEGSTRAGSSNGRNPADVAKQYLGRDATDLRGDRSDNLPMNANVPANVCCANFVSAVLTESGQLPGNLHTDSVSQLNSTLRSRGWTEVSAADARPGDVVIIQGGGVSHTVLYAGNGQTIGSNNRNADGTQKVSYGSLSWALSNGGKILRAPASVRETSTPAAANDSGKVGAPAASRQGRIDQAMTFFQSQGWTRAQAAGIVANLDAESGMDAGIRQHGGGPGYGLAQWEGPRQADFAAWAGHDIRSSTFQEQLRFIQHELTTSESGAGNRLRQSSSAGDAAAIVCRYYERPADIVDDSAHRAQLANTIFQR